jgi:hypothetical protein
MNPWGSVVNPVGTLAVNGVMVVTQLSVLAKNCLRYAKKKNAADYTLSQGYHTTNAADSRSPGAALRRLEKILSPHNQR